MNKKTNPDFVGIDIHGYDIDHKTQDYKSLHKEMTEVNMENAKNGLLSQRGIKPCVFIYTKNNVWYVEPDLEVAARTKSSPLDQVAPIINYIDNSKDNFGNIMSYQMIGEAWAKTFSDDKSFDHIAYGDISHMASSIELLFEAIVEKDKGIHFNMYKIIRKENTGNIVDLVKSEEHNEVFQTTKFPLIKSDWPGLQ